MPMFKPIPFDRTRQGQLQEIYCPRCKALLKGEEVSSYGEGVNVRVVRGDYHCPCGYGIIVEEHYPIINRAQETERHIP